MARVQYGGGVVAFIGSVGGSTFQNNSSGKIVRSRPFGNRSSTLKQTQAHADHIYWLAQWQSITQPQRDLWNTFANAHLKVNKFGQEKKLTGQNWFESTNLQKSTAGGTFMATPPAYVLPGAPPTFTLTADTNTLKIKTTSAFSTAENWIMVSATLPTRRSTLSINRIRKKLGYIVPVINVANDITNLWQLATNLPWNPTTLFPSVNIFVCIQSISKTSGITSSYLCSSIVTPTPSATEDNFYYYI